MHNQKIEQDDISSSEISDSEDTESEKSEKPTTSNRRRSRLPKANKTEKEEHEEDKLQDKNQNQAQPTSSINPAQQSMTDHQAKSNRIEEDVSKSQETKERKEFLPQKLFSDNLKQSKQQDELRFFEVPEISESESESESESKVSTIVANKRKESLTQRLTDKMFRRNSSIPKEPLNTIEESKYFQERIPPHKATLDAINRESEPQISRGKVPKKQIEPALEHLSKEEFLTSITQTPKSRHKPDKLETDSLSKSEELEPKRRESLTQRIADKILRRRSSTPEVEGELKPLKPIVRKERLKSLDEDSPLSNKTTLKHSEGPPVRFSTLVETPEEEEDVSTMYQKKPSVYNPFGSFQRHVSLALPDEDKTTFVAPATQQSSVTDRKQSNANDRLRRLSSLKPTRKRSISAADLTKQDIAICFFPEEPDWDEYGEEDDFPGRQHTGSIFPDLKSTQAKRERWESRLVYLIALITYSISFSNIYHFPALVYHYGGIPFLIPYTIFTIILGYPLHFLESSLGQYSQSGPVRVWDCAPIARGIGWSMFLLCLGVGYYYNMYAAYSVIYFSRCFNKVLPWQDCDEPANPLSNYSCVPRMCARIDQNHYTPAEHYFFDHILQIHYSDKILSNGLGPMVWTEVLGFFLAWIFIYAAIIQGVRSIGKVVFFLVILPYFVLFMLLTAGFLLKGSSRGLYMLFGTDFERLLDIQVWRSAAEQVFFELGICQGIPLAYGSYCRHLNPIHIDSAIVCLVNYFTSILCAVVIFNILGALSTEMGAPIADVIHHGPAVVFITYTEALSRVPGSHFWCFSFFLMLFSVAIGTQIAIMETVMTVVYDEFYNAKPFRWLINLLICCCLFIIGIILCTSNGYFVVHLLDRMTGNMPRLPIAVCMAGTIILIYGVTKYCEDMHFMLNYYPNMFIRFCFLIIPILLVALTIPSWLLMRPLTVRGKDYTIDPIMVGWFTIWFILVWIILGILYWVVYCHYIGRLKDVWRSLNSWGPRSYMARIARTEFSSEDVSNFTKSWTKRNVT